MVEFAPPVQGSTSRSRRAVFAAVAWPLFLSMYGLSQQSPTSTKTPIPVNERKGFDAISEAMLRAHLTYIASDKLAGRLSLRPGDDLAVEWVAE